MFKYVGVFLLRNYGIQMSPKYIVVVLWGIIFRFFVSTLLVSFVIMEIR